MKRTAVFILLFLIFMPAGAWAKDKKIVPSSAEGIKVVIAEGKAVLGDDTTPAQAKAIAMNNARRNALEEAVGVNLHSSTLVYNSQLISDLISTATKGLIVAQKVIDEKCYTEGGNIYCSAKIEAQVKPHTLEKGKKISIVKASVQRPDRDSASNNPVFQDGDEIQIKVTANEDSFMNIFSVDQYGNIIKLFPNDYVKAEILPSKKEFVFPDNNIRERGLKFRLTAPKNLSKAIESVLIIATKEEGNFLSDKTIQNPTISDLMKELSEIDQSSWDEETVGYEVRK